MEISSIPYSPIWRSAPRTRRSPSAPTEESTRRTTASCSSSEISDSVRNLADGNGAPQQGAPFEFMEPFRFRQAGDSDDRHAELKQLRHFVATDIAQIDDDRVGEARADGFRCIVDGEIAHRVVAALDQLRAEEGPRPLVGVDDPDDFHSVQCPVPSSTSRGHWAPGTGHWALLFH